MYLQITATIMNIQLIWLGNKNDYIINHMAKAINDDKPVICIDPNGFIANGVVKYLNKKKIKDKQISFVNLSTNQELQEWFNLLLTSSDQAEVAKRVETLVSFFIEIFWKELFWPRIQDCFRHAVTLMMHHSTDKHYTLLQIPRFFSDKVFAEKVFIQSDNIVAKKWYQSTFKGMAERERQEIIPYFNAKFSVFTNDIRIRNILWNSKSQFVITKEIEKLSTIIISLPQADLWEHNTSILCRTILWMMIEKENLLSEYNIYFPDSEYYYWDTLLKILKKNYLHSQPVIFSYWDEINESLCRLSQKVYVKDIWSSDKRYLEENAIKYKELDHIDLPSGNNSDDDIKKIQKIFNLRFWVKKDLLEKDIMYQLWV